LIDAEHAIPKDQVSFMDFVQKLVRLNPDNAGSGDSNDSKTSAQRRRKRPVKPSASHEKISVPR
jgi:hypothetical protein